MANKFTEIKNTLEFIAIPLAIGFIIGLSFAYVHIANSMQGIVCGDVCMDSDDFYRMFEKWKEAETMKTICSRGIEWLDVEFNFTEIIGVENMINFSDKYYGKFEAIRQEHDEYFDILEGAYVK